MDMLADMMALLRTKGHVYGCLELTGPFALEFPHEVGHFLILTEGQSFLDVPGQPPVALSAGDFVFLPSSKAFSLRSSSDPMPVRTFSRTEAQEYSRTNRLIVSGGDGPQVSLVSGCFTFSAPESQLLVGHLPSSLVLPSGAPGSPVHSILQGIIDELAQGRPGSATVIERLSEVLFIQALRNHFYGPSTPQVPSWLRALGDPQIGASLEKIHKDPGRPWTVQELAGAVGMSRSAFASKFKALVGTTPLEHLTQWRMVRAAGLIKAPKPPKLEVIAASVGYESESAFRKAFSKIMGASPSEYRSGRSA